MLLLVIYLIVLLQTARVTEAGCWITPDTNGHVDVPEGTLTIGTDVFSTFAECFSLKSVSIPNSVTSIGD